MIHICDNVAVDDVAVIKWRMRLVFNVREESVDVAIKTKEASAGKKLTTVG